MLFRNKEICLLLRAFLFSFLLLSVILSLTVFFYWKSTDGLPQPSNSAVSSVPAENLPTVILDAGHGGPDPGAISVLGDREKDFNLKITKCLAAFLEEAGICVVYTRTEDVLLESSQTNSRKMGDLLGRVEIAKSNPDAVFVSIHMNTLSIEKYRGLQVFYSDQNGSSRALAQSIQHDVKTMLQPENHREAKEAKGTIYILDRIPQTAVLIECGFLSNYEEATMLSDEDYQKKMCFVLSRSILEYVLS